MRPELWATHAALQLAQQGTPFREAYRRIAQRLRCGQFVPPTESEPSLQPQTLSEMLAATEDDVKVLTEFFANCEHRVRRAEADLLPTK